MTHDDSRGPTEKRKIFADGLVVFPNAILVSDGIVLHDAEQVLNRRGARFVVQRWQTFDATNGESEKLRRTQTSKYRSISLSTRQLQNANPASLKIHCMRQRAYAKSNPVLTCSG